jgi:hypothetical protein
MRTLMWRTSIALTDDLKLLLPIRWSPDEMARRRSSRSSY